MAKDWQGTTQMQHKGEPRRQVRGRYPRLGGNEAPGIKKVSLSARGIDLKDRILDPL